MTYEVNEIFEIGDAGATIQSGKEGFMDEVSGLRGPNPGTLDEE